jgi:predicted AlkP superfamily phosphohydrolase/phosphomutase
MVAGWKATEMRTERETGKRAEAEAGVSRKRRILLIGWDAADWRHIEPLLEAGMMPVLAGLIGRGVRGNLASLMPMVSPMLWTTIATGKTADAHGVHGFV